MLTLAEVEQHFVELLRIPSVTGHERPAIEFLEQLLDRFGVEHRRISKLPDRPNLLATIRSKNPTEKPFALISHIDVVDGDAASWTYPVFGGEVHDGRIHGRGSLDTKQLTMMELYSFIGLVGHDLKRDVHFLASCDEEAGSSYGMAYVKQAMPELFENVLVLNEGGGFPLSINGQDFMMLTVGEKAMIRVRIQAETLDDQPILRLAEALERIFAADADAELDFGSCAVYEAMKAVMGTEHPDNKVAADIFNYTGQNSIGMRDYRIGKRSSAPGGKVEAILEFKLKPGAKAEDVQAFVSRQIQGLPVRYELVDEQAGFEQDLSAPDYKQFVSKLEAATSAEGFPFKVLPMLALGRTDGRFFGPEGSTVYGCSPVLMQDSFDRTLPRVHGDNESIGQASFRFGCRVVDRLVREACFGR